MNRRGEGGAGDEERESGRERESAASTQKLQPSGKAAASASVRAVAAIQGLPSVTLLVNGKRTVFYGDFSPRAPHSLCIH